MIDEPHLYLRIHDRDGAGGLSWENADGALFPVPHEIAASGLSPGDVVAVRGDNWEKVDPSLWVERSRVGVVRSVSDDAIVVDTSLEVVAAKDLANTRPNVGNTVVLNSRNEIVGLASSEAIERAPIQIDRTDEDFDPGQFLETSDMDWEWQDFGGFPEIIEQAREIVDVHLKQRVAYENLGVRPLRGVIFEGPPGTGKTFLAKIMASKAGAALYVVGAAELGGRLVGESEGRLQQVYDHAAEQPLSIVFVDELDSISHHRGGESANHADRLVSTFLVNMDGFHAKDNILTIGTTNRIEAVDAALRRSGRFSSEITFRRPDASDRYAILRAGAKRRGVEGVLSHDVVADITDGWSAADIDEVWTAAATLTILAGRSRIEDDHYVMGAERVATRLRQKRGVA